MSDESGYTSAEAERKMKMTPDELEAAGYPRDFWDLTPEQRQEWVDGLHADETPDASDLAATPEDSHLDDPAGVEVGQVYSMKLLGMVGTCFEVVPTPTGWVLPAGVVAVKILSHPQNVATIDPVHEELSNPLVGRMMPYPAIVLLNPDAATLEPAAAAPAPDPAG